MSDELSKHPIIPVIVIEDEADAEPLAEALLEGGMGIAEVTFRTEAAAGAIARISRKFPEMLVGAGTVLTKDQADRAIDSGALFGVAPGLNPDTVGHFTSTGRPFVPGVMTPSEIEQGMALGCGLLKFFPAGPAGGIKMLQALAGPYASSGVKFCPTGGINKDNMLDYLSLPIVATIGGSWIASKQQIAEGNWSAITAQAKEALEIASSIDR